MLATLVLTAAALGAQSLALVPAVGRTSRRGAMAATALAAAAADDDAPVGKACACGSNKAYVSCCRPLHKDAGARVAAGAREVLSARYSAYVEREADFVMDTTHPSNDDYDEDRDAWRAKVLDFARASTFVGLEVYDEVERDDGRTSITWTARLKVLDGLVDDRLVETKDFVERSIFERSEEGGFLYVEGDPDFEPKNLRVGGPLDPKPSPPKRKAPAKATAKAPALVR